MYKRVFWSVFAVVVLAGMPALAQPGRGGSSDFRQRMMERMDGNGDGKLDENEVPERAREYVARASREAGGSGKFPISISSISGGSSGRGSRDRGSRDRGGDRGRGDSRSRDRRGGEEKEFQFPLVAAFGDEVQSFGLDPRQLNGRMVDYEKMYDDKVLRQLKQTMDSYDKDKNGVLEFEEWEKVAWQSDPRVSDLNKDGQLTSAELAERYRIRFGGGERKSSSRSSSSSRESSSRERSSGDRGGKDRGRGEASSRGGSMFGGRGGGDRGGSRGGGDRGGGGRSFGGFDPSSMVSRLDKDGDGYIDFDKMDDRTKGFTSRFLSRYGIETTGKVKVDKIVSQIKGGSSSSKKSSKDKKPPKLNPEMTASQITRGADQYDGKFTYRKDRDTPDDVPDWWGDRDKNRDGQVSMAEYLTTRSNDAVGRFNKMDRNRDGILEPSEAKGK